MGKQFRIIFECVIYFVINILIQQIFLQLEFFQHGFHYTRVKSEQLLSERGKFDYIRFARKCSREILMHLLAAKASSHMYEVCQTRNGSIRNSHYC
jgi:hypothetical protein